jgi:hypothetical protein
VSSGAVTNSEDASVGTVVVAVAVNLLVAVAKGLVLAHVVPVQGADLLVGVGRLRRRLLSVPAVAAVEITPVERAS